MNSHPRADSGKPRLIHIDNPARGPHLYRARKVAPLQQSTLFFSPLKPTFSLVSTKRLYYKNQWKRIRVKTLLYTRMGFISFSILFLSHCLSCRDKVTPHVSTCFLWIGAHKHCTAANICNKKFTSFASDDVWRFSLQIYRKYYTQLYYAIWDRTETLKCGSQNATFPQICFIKHRFAQANAKRTWENNEELLKGSN